VVVVVAVLLALTAACPGIDDIDPPSPNTAPAARLLYPQRWPAGTPAPLVADTGTDPDSGDATTFTLNPGDGSPAQTRTIQGAGDGTFRHTFALPGRYTVRLVAKDSQDQSEVGAVVVVVGEDADLTCSCELPCPDEAPLPDEPAPGGPATCTETGCLLFVASDEQPPPPLPDVATCP
jgi:hypothetical protein